MPNAMPMSFETDRVKIVTNVQRRWLWTLA